MKLLTYRLGSSNPFAKQQFLRALHQNVLSKDGSWHFFLDPEGGTLRFQPKFEGKVRKFLKNHAKAYQVKWQKRSPYIPKNHEYYGVSFLGDDILPLFHDLSVLTTEYPPYVMTRSVLERLTHGLVNMSGIHDFAKESDLYLGLADGRIKIIKQKLALPLWLYRIYYKIIKITKKNERKTL